MFIDILLTKTNGFKLQQAVQILLFHRPCFIYREQSGMVDLLFYLISVFCPVLILMPNVHTQLALMEVGLSEFMCIALVSLSIGFWFDARTDPSY